MPTRTLHGLVMARLTGKIQEYLQRNPIGRCYVASGCKLENGEIIHPDLSVVLKDNSSIVRDFIMGPPDWIAEVIDEDDSPFSISDQLQLYRRTGIRELWIVSPKRLAAWVGVLRPNGWEALPRHQACIESKILDGLRVEIDPLFEP